MEDRRPGSGGIVILALFLIAGVAQCGRKRAGHRPDACDGRPTVTIGGSMAVGCR